MKDRAVYRHMLALLALCIAGGVNAQEKACLLEGSITMGDMHQDIKDCLENHGVPVTQLKDTCGSLAQATTAFGGPPAKITYLGACPPAPQGVCEGFFGQPLSSYYYKRDAKLLADSKTGCLAQGGKWHG